MTRYDLKHAMTYLGLLDLYNARNERATAAWNDLPNSVRAYTRESLADWCLRWNYEQPCDVDFSDVNPTIPDVGQGRLMLMEHHFFMVERTKVLSQKKVRIQDATDSTGPKSLHKWEDLQYGISTVIPYPRASEIYSYYKGFKLGRLAGGGEHAGVPYFGDTILLHYGIRKLLDE